MRKINFTLGLLAGCSLAGLAAPAMAQEPVAAPVAAPAAAPAAPAEGEIVVTGSRIVSSGFSAPTPTQMVDSSLLQQNAQPNIFNTVAQLPSLMGSTGATVGNNSTSSGTQGLSSFALHGLGTIRTLTLLDGQRVVGANVTGVPDISLFPQILVERVDVVTGGASASYGSDAVGGVVNFITNKHFEGVKGNFQTGISDYGDNAQGTAQIALGQSFMDGRLHVIVSGEYDYEQGVGPGGFGEQGPSGRDWYRTSTFFDTGNLAGGTPQYIRGDHAQAYQYSKYGLITAGPLQGTAIGADGRPFTFTYGTNAAGVQGVPAKDAKGTVNNCFNGFCMGGDLSGNVGIGTTLQARIKRWNTYSRIGFDINPDNEFYVTANIAKIQTRTQPNPGAAKQGITIQCNNPFVPELVQEACGTNGITSFQYGVSNAILPNISVNPTREQYRFVAGMTGKFNALGTNWHYDTYYQHGESITDIRVQNITLNSRYNAAVQAISLNGQIVCADPVARANGCVPLNIFGNVAPSAATLNYIEPGAGPYQHTRQKQDVASFNISGDPINLWAGPLSVATGAEWRREWYRVTGDPYSNGNGAASGPEAALYPVDPLLTGIDANGAGGNNWYAGNYRSGGGSYHVLEGFLELNLPIVDSEKLGRANLDGGVRVTDYSTSGTAWTWKIGGNWTTPIDGIRLRAVTSRDVRAPNLSELFAAGSSVNTPNFSITPFPGAPVNILQITSGNPNLKPEVGRNTTAGIVLSRPRWAPGLNISVDWYKVKVTGVISSLSPTQIVTFCHDGVLANCNSLTNSYFDISHRENNGQGNFVNTQPFNLAKLKVEGIDMEASYQFVRPLGLDGNLTLRALATHVIHNITDTGLPGSIPIDSAGVNSGATPNWKLLGMQTYSTDKWRFTLQERWFSDGVYNSTYVVCQTNCPVSTGNHRTIDYNKMPGAFYLDVSGSYNITKNIEAYVKVDNLLNRDPEPSPATNTGIDLNPTLYDVIGRMYRVGVRLNF